MVIIMAGGLSLVDSGFWGFFVGGIVLDVVEASSRKTTTRGFVFSLRRREHGDM